MAVKTGYGMVLYALKQLGVPYFYGAKMQILTESLMAQMQRLYPKTVTASYIAKARKKGMVGKICCDCSGLIGAYRGKQIGSSQLYSSASKRIPISLTMPEGTVVWKSGHVGVYVGNGYVVEEKGIDHGCVKTKLSSTKWVCGLLFSDLTYNTANPYTEPVTTIKLGSKGNDVGWLQYELIEAGYGSNFTYNKKKYKAVTIDEDFGAITDAATRSFQQSCKIEVDGKVGPTTRKYLKER